MFLKFEKDQYMFFLCLVEFACETTWSWMFVCKEFAFFFKLQILFHFWCLICSNYLFLLDSILLGSVFLEICPFLLGCLFLQYLLLRLLFHFLFYLGSLCFVRGELGQRYVNFLCSFKKPVLGFIDFFPPLKKSLFPLWYLLLLPSADFSFFLFFFFV